MRIRIFGWQHRSRDWPRRIPLKAVFAEDHFDEDLGLTDGELELDEAIATFSACRRTKRLLNIEFDLLAVQETGHVTLTTVRKVSCSLRCA